MLFCATAATAQTNDNWTSYHADAQASIEYQLVDYNKPADGIYKKVYQLRYSNLTQQPVRVRFNRVTWYGAKCYGCAQNGDEHTYQVDLQPGEVLTADPALRDKRFYIFHSGQQGEPPLTKFELLNITVEAR